MLLFASHAPTGLTKFVGIDPVPLN